MALVEKKLKWIFQESQKQITLVQKQKGFSDLRVSLLAMDNDGSTDVAPRASLYLTTFNESERREAGSVHEISDINELISAERLEAGLYKAVVTKYDWEELCGKGADEACFYLYY